jgi:hypothetical protein
MVRSVLALIVVHAKGSVPACEGKIGSVAGRFISELRASALFSLGVRGFSTRARDCSLSIISLGARRLRTLGARRLSTGSRGLALLSWGGLSSLSLSS